MIRLGCFAGLFQYGFIYFSGKFRAPSSESPPSAQFRDNASPKSSPTSSRKDLKQTSDRETETNPYNHNQFQDKTASVSPQLNASVKHSSEDTYVEDITTKITDSERGRGNHRHLHGQMEHAKRQANENEQFEEHESRFEDEEVDVDDLPPEVRKNTLQQRQLQQLRGESKNQTNKKILESNNLLSNEPPHKSLHQSMSHEMDDALVDSLVSLVNEDEGSSNIPEQHNSPSVLTESNRVRQQSQESRSEGRGNICCFHIAKLNNLSSTITPYIWLKLYCIALI